jgi:hypothetical protein
LAVGEETRGQCDTLDANSIAPERLHEVVDLSAHVAELRHAEQRPNVRMVPVPAQGVSMEQRE